MLNECKVDDIWLNKILIKKAKKTKYWGKNEQFMDCVHALQMRFHDVHKKFFLGTIIRKSNAKYSRRCL